MANVTILGTGMAGFGAAHRLHNEGITPVMYDKDGYHGGHTASFRYETGFLFDVGPHISYTKDPRIQQLFAESVDQQYETLQVYLNNYWRGYWPQHPVQLHLHGLPEDVIIKVIADFANESQMPERPVTNYADWLLTSFGQSFAALFPMQYTRKYHTTAAENLTTDWLGPRIYRPSLEEVLRGALSPTAPQIHYITHFRYPKQGGFVSYLNKFVPFGNLKLGHKLTSIDPRARLLTFANGVVAKYDALISSVPLPDLIPMIQGTPTEVLDASRRLACTTCVLVNIGVNREDISKAHVTYFYDEDICFARLGFPHMLAASNAPAGTGSIQAEVYFSNKYKPFTGSADDWIEPVITDLRQCGLLRDDDQILCRKAMLLPYANVIFDQERATALRTVHGYLDDIGIAYCGRYGDWGYEFENTITEIDSADILAPHANYRSFRYGFVKKLAYHIPVKPLSERIASKCAYLSPGVDAIRFCPYPHPPQRVVDVLSVGRRSETTHRALLRMADKEGLFYLHDTIAGGEALNANDHRAITRNLAKRSRYFIVNPGLIDRPDIRGSQIEIGNRYFEGSAAGAILLGERPENEVFGKLFDWPDALVRLPYDSPEVDEIIHELDLQPEGQEMIRRMNVAQALLRHDWVYRWESILESVNLEPLPQLLKRKNRLRSLADTIMPTESAAPCARF